jgi:hypothetical protein
LRRKALALGCSVAILAESMFFEREADRHHGSARVALAVLTGLVPGNSDR